MSDYSDSEHEAYLKGKDDGYRDGLLQAERIAKRSSEFYPMTGKPDNEASFKNGWYDASYAIEKELEGIRKALL